MLRRNARPLYLLLLLLLFVVAPVAALAGPDLTVTVTHTGTSGANFTTNSTTGTVSVAVQNVGDLDTAGNITVTVTLAGGLTYHAFGSSSSGLFTTCTGTSTVSCTTSGVITAGATETVTFTVNAPADPNAGPFTNSASISGGGDVNNANNSADDATTFGIYNAGVDLRLTVSHVGNAGNNYVVNTTDGTVTVKVQNLGTDPTVGTITVFILTNSDLAFNTQTAGNFFTNCSGTSSITCSTATSFASGQGDTITFTVKAPSTIDYDNRINAFLTGGSDPDGAVTQDAQMYSIIASGTETATVTAGPSPTATFPLPTFTVAPTLIPATAVPSATLIPPPATRTPLPRPANAGQAVGPIPHPNVTIVIDRDGVNVRLLPAIGAEVIATVNGGYSTNILARSGDGQWVQVEIGGQLGWIGQPVFVVVAGDLNSAPVADPRTIPYGGFENPRAGLTSVTSPLTGKLQDSGLRVRGGPGRAYPVLANAPRYTIFSLLGRTENNTWVQVNFEGTLGWVAAQFVDFQQGLGTFDQLPIDGIVADALPISEPTGDSYTDTLKLMLARVELSQPSLDEVRAIWTNVALGGRATCGSYPARPTDFNIPNPVLAPFYATLYPLQTDFNAAMSNLRQAIDLLINACRTPQPPEGLVGQPVVQAALDAVNAADANFASLRQRLNALLPPDQPVTDDECLFTFANRSEIVPRLRINEAQIVTLSATHFVKGFCFDGGTGQSLKIETLLVSGNARPRLTVSAFDNATNFIGTAQMDETSTLASIQPILITQTGRYILIFADLDGAANNAPLQGENAVLLTDITGGTGAISPSLAIDPTTGNVIVTTGSIAAATFAPGVTPGVGVTPGIPLEITKAP